MTQKKQIMVVEDNWLNREMLVEILADRYAVLEAENGQEALELLQQHQDDIALILLDVMMPVMDGYTFLDRIKADQKLALIPVIVMTQSDNEEDEVDALAHGATDYVAKPYRLQVILHRVASIIKLREDAAMANLFKYDRLTGLYSKEYFYQRVRERLLEDSDGEYNIVCSNIENFKVYNDSFGVEAGDRLLREFADMSMKMIGKGGICGRFSGDRFLILQERGKELTNRERMTADIWSNFHAGQNCVVMKYGVYEITDRSVPVEQMCDRAFLAADSIKGQYNQWLAVYDNTLRDKLLREQAITEAMETALKEGQFTVYLQPKYSLHNDGLAGAEALVRWIHPEWGFMSPGEFIPLFEKNGFITRLDRYVWERVCAMLRDWQEKGYPSLPVSVNVSRADIYQANLPDMLSDLVREYDLKPDQLHLELTESAYTENPAQIIAVVDQLRKLGFIIEMDDFGSGYSSLNMLNQMKLDILKLDMKFIQSETAKPTEQGILQFVITLARWLNLSVVAEGVETWAQLERLREVGCDYVQGYYFARPLPREEFEELLKRNPAGTMESDWPKRENTGLRRLLIADEDADYRKRVRQTFESQYQVLEADSAESAIACVREYGHNGVSAVILSTKLPDAGTERFLRSIRQDPMLWRIPVMATLPSGEVTEDMIQHLDTDDFLCKRHPLCDLRRRVSYLMNMVSCREREQMLKEEACRDYLTDLLNRRGFYTAMGALRQEDLPLACYLFDVDNLKQLNDRNGHEEGDAMLRSFAELLRRHTRSGDILCRYGGDEFVVVLRHISSVETILRKGETICREFRDSVAADGTHAACSAGIALCSFEEKPSAKLIERADQALYRAKRENKGGCCLWDGARASAES